MRKLLITLIGLVFSIFFTACNDMQEIEFQSDAYARDSGYPVAFSAFSAEKGNIRYFFESDTISEDEALNYMEWIDKDENLILTEVDTLDETLPDKPVNIYVVEDLVNDLIIIDDNNLFISKSDIEDKSYRYYLLQVITDMNQNAKSYGLYGYIFETEYDNEEIGRQLSNSDECFDMLDLFWGRTLPVYENQESIELFENIVISLADNTISAKGLEAYYNEGITETDINLWLQDIGVSKVYSNSSLTLTETFEAVNIEGYDFCLKDGDVYYKFKNCFDYFEDIEELETLVCHEAFVRRDITDYLKGMGINDAAENVGLNSIEYDISYEVNATSYTRIKGYEENPQVELRTPREVTIAHELMHVVINNTNRQADKYWLEEGVCEYLSWVVYAPSIMREGLYEVLNDEQFEEGRLRNYYFEKNDGVLKEEDYNIIAVYNYYVYVKDILEDEEHLSVNFGNPIGTYYNSQGSGSELTYMEAMSFTGYLIDSYDFEKVWNFMKSEESYTDAFGKGYKELKMEWLNSLKTEGNN